MNMNMNMNMNVNVNVTAWAYWYWPNSFVHRHLGRQLHGGGRGLPCGG
jgi:hypothetical protein